MLRTSTQLIPNEAEVAASVVDGEAIIINLSNGIYYSLDGTGGFIWELIAARRTVADIADAILEQYDVSAEQAAADLERLVSELISEKLVSALDGGMRDAPSSPPGRQPRRHYTSPRLEIYRDLGDLMAMDPPMPPLSEIISSKRSGDAEPSYPHA